MRVLENILDGYVTIITRFFALVGAATYYVIGALRAGFVAGWIIARDYDMDFERPIVKETPK